MRSTRILSPTFLSLLLLVLLAASGATTVRAAAAADEDYPDEYDETARVARVSLIRGEVSLRRNGSTEWEEAKLNLPLVEGDTLATARDARVEIQIDARNFVRVDEESVLRIVTLRDEGVALSLSEGTVTLRLARFDREREYFEIDAPRTTVAAEQQGVYRFDVEADSNRVRLTVRDGGRARVYSDTSGFTVRDGRTAELVYEGTDAGDWNLTAASTFDPWDFWVTERERYLAKQLRYDERDRYYDREVWGAEELDAYGDWSYAGDYGWVWRPHTTVINNYYNWAPYRHGHWTWCPPYGWTWVGDEPWGWAPYHYGRWVYFNNSWCWAPRGYGYNYRRSWWRPALVAFVYIPTSYGEHVAWYPLGHRQHDPRGRHYRQRQLLAPLRRGELARLERSNPAFLRAVTTQPTRDFGQRTARLQPAAADIARRAVTGEPVRGRLPILPPDGGGTDRTNTGGLDRRARATARPTATLPARVSSLPERPTGAATRTPGASLDNELRRTRLYNNREPRSVSGTNERGGSGGNTGSGGGTGAVARPPRARAGERQPPVPEEQRSNDDSNLGAPGYGRPARPPRVNPVETRTPAPEANDSPSPGRRDDEPASRPRPRPSQPPRDESPAPRPEPRYEPRPEPRPETRPAPRPVQREEPRPEPRREAPPPAPRPEPRQESRPEPPPEPRQESRPEPRPEPRQEAPPRQESKPEPREERPARPERRGDRR